jgi:hypothetical protein
MLQAMLQVLFISFGSNFLVLTTSYRVTVCMFTEVAYAVGLVACFVLVCIDKLENSSDVQCQDLNITLEQVKGIQTHWQL